MKSVAHEAMPERIEPMKARLEDPDPTRDWQFEVKWDGYRAIAFCGDRLKLQGRRLNEITADFPELAPLAAQEGCSGCIFDGELAVFDEGGIPDFQLMQARRDLGLEVRFLIFDLLWSEGQDLRSRSYLERRRLLEGIGPAGSHWSVPERLDGDLDEVMAATAALGLEGVIAKDPDSPYVSGRRTRYWRKVKHVRRQEFVIGGWLPGRGHRASTLGALLVGYHDPPGGELRFAGRVGTGMSQRLLAELAHDLSSHRRETPPFRESDLAAIPRDAEWTEPRTVVEVKFTQWTQDGFLRNPVFVGYRPEKAPDEVVREEA